MIWDCESIELRRLERFCIVGAIGVPAFRTAPVYRLVKFAVGVELVHPQQGDLRHVRVPGALRRVRYHEPKAATVVQEFLDHQFLVAHHHHVVVEPRSVNRCKSRIVQGPHIDAGDLDADLRSHAMDLNHGCYCPFRRAGR